MKIIFNFFICGIFVFGGSAKCLASEINIKASVDKKDIRVGEVITYKLTVFSPEKNLPAPKIADFSGFKVVSSLRSSNISFSRGSVSNSVTYSFILAPTREGRFKIAPSYTDFRHKRYESESFDIDVKTNPDAVAPKIKPGTPDNEERDRQQQMPSYTI